MALRDLKTVNDSVMGLDLSTNSIAFGMIKKDKLVYFGEIELNGDLYSRIATAGRASLELGKKKPDLVAFEAPAFVNNRQVVIKLAMVCGAVLSGFNPTSTIYKEVGAMEWQRYIGNFPATKADKQKLKKESGKSDSWVKNELRKQRKQFTINFVEQQFGRKFESDNVADACAIAFYGWRNLLEK